MKNKILELQPLTEDVISLNNKQFFLHVRQTLEARLKNRAIVNKHSGTTIQIPNTGLNHTVFLSRGRGFRKEVERAAILSIDSVLKNAIYQDESTEDRKLGHHYATKFFYKGKEYKGEAIVIIHRTKKNFYHHKLLWLEIK